MMRPLVYLSSLAFLSLIVVVEGEQNATRLRLQKEGELEKVVGLIKDNFGRCELLETCTGPTCSRLSCYKYGTDQGSQYGCQGVLNNTNCGSNCKWKNFDYSKSFVRRVVDDQISARTICAHKTLDDTFKTMSDNKQFFLVYFGSTDGTMRIFPGADENLTSCSDGSYDPRLRPWYKKSIFVQKAVIVLVDVGESMQAMFKPGGGPKDETYISKAKNIILNFLYTLDENDFINVTLFNAGNVALPPVLNDSLLINVNDIAKLRERISAKDFGVIPAATQDDSNATHASNAINGAISQLMNVESTSGYIPNKNLKVIIVLTRSPLIANLAGINHTSDSVILFVYKLEIQDYSVNYTCDIGGKSSFEMIPDVHIDNPLYAIRSYYRFLAKMHNISNSKTDYSPQFDDYSKIDNGTFTLSKSVFWGNNSVEQLLGVVGINFFPQKVKAQYKINPDELRDAFNPNAAAPAPIVPLGDYPSVCVNHMDPCQTNIDNLPTGQNYGICNVINEDTAWLKKLSCCGKCNRAGNWPPGKIAGVVVACVVGLGLLIIGCFYFIRTQNSLRNNDFVFPGDYVD